MSAHSLPSRRGWLSALAAQVASYVFEEVEEQAAPEPVVLDPRPVIAVVSAAPRSGASTISRLLAADLATRADGAATVITPAVARRPAPPTRAAVRLATGLTGAGTAQPCGRLCLIPTLAGDASEHRMPPAVEAARYLAPVVVDLPPDGSASAIATAADRVVVVGSGAGEPALVDAVAHVLGGSALKVANRVIDPDPWRSRVDFTLPDSRIAARAAALGTRALGELGAGIGAIADALEARQ